MQERLKAVWKVFISVRELAQRQLSSTFSLQIRSYTFQFTAIYRLFKKFLFAHHKEEGHYSF
jgi:hypothetical protein